MRLDVFRGLALVMIYINHVPGTVFEHFTSRNFGFSDAAEAFVVMSGVAAGIAYSGTVPEGLPWYNARRAWGRSWTLYMVHIVTMTMAIGVSAAAARWFGAAEMIEVNNMAAIFDDALGVMVGTPTLLFQLGYFDILPLYAVLVAATPAMIWLGARRPLVLLVLSLAIWAAAGATRTNFPAYPVDGGWFFNPLSWQLIFVIGLLTGIALRRGERLVPVARPLLVAACGFLIFALVWRLLPPVGAAGRAMLRAGYESGLPFYLVGFDKAYLAAPRLLHALALVYVLSALPVFREAAEAWWTRPLALMGRRALPVFATGSVLSIIGQSIKAATTDSAVVDAWIIGGGLLIQVALALMLSRLSAVKAVER